MRLARPLSRLSKNILLFERFFLQRLIPSVRISEIIFLVIWKEHVYCFFVGAASSRDRFNSRLEAAFTGLFFSCLDLPDKRNYF